MIKVSIIIPAHNTAEYLKKCLDSMINQTIKDIEIIVVDDASEPPIKPTIYEEYKEYDNIIFLRNDIALRPGGARNRGLDIARGQYVSFCDSDDWVDLNLYENVVKYMDSSNADIGMVSMKRNADHLKNHIYKCKYEQLYTLSSATAIHILSGNYDMGINIVPACINKIYRRNFIEKINARFEEDIYFQGILYSILTFLSAKKIICVPHVTYHHYLRIKSITQSFDRKHIQDFKECFKRMKLYFEKAGVFEKYASDYYRILEIYLNVLVSELFEYVYDEEIQKKFIQEILKAMREVVNFDDYIKYITAEKLRQHIQPHIKLSLIHI